MFSLKPCTSESKSIIRRYLHFRTPRWTIECPEMVGLRRATENDVTVSNVGLIEMPSGQV